METLKHFEWVSEYGRGRVAVRLTDSRFSVTQIAGKAPPALGGFLAQVTEDVWHLLSDAEARRTLPWCVERIDHQNGAVTFAVRVQRDANLGDHPVTSRLHISPEGRLTGGAWGPLEDLEVYLSIFAKMDMEKNVDSIDVWEVPIFQPAEGWNYPSPHDGETTAADAPVAVQAQGVE